MRKLLVGTVLGLAMVLGSATFALAASTNPDAQPIADPTSSPDAYMSAPLYLAPTDTEEDNSLLNANQSGVNVGGQTAHPEVIKSQDMTNINGTTGTQRTHGEYQNNTNSCASCHQTHTAAAKNLLIKSSVYDTCTACHDGTLGFYNVFTASSAGTFAGTADGNASMHLPDGSMEIKAAPGGNRLSTDAAGTGWSAEFDCASCHSPHGSYSDRLLAYNPNDIANTPAEDGGLQVVAGTLSTTDGVFTALPVADATSPDVLLYAVQSTDTTNYPAGATGTALIVMKKKENHGTYSYIRDINPWVAGGEYGQPKFTRFLQNITETSTTADEAASANQITGITVNYAKGYATAATDLFSTAKKIVIARASLVKFVENIGIDPVSKAQVTTVNFANYDDAGLGVQITQFCAACHTDYQAKSGSETGVWSKAFRHTTTSDSYTCLKCHYAHGTDVNVMLDAKNNTVASLVAGGLDATVAKNYMMDKNPTSALKRYTNMAVCWECHNSSHSTDLVNNQFKQGTANLTTSEFNTQGTDVPVKFVDPTSYPYPTTPPGYVPPVIP